MAEQQSVLCYKAHPLQIKFVFTFSSFELKYCLFDNPLHLVLCLEGLGYARIVCCLLYHPREHFLRPALNIQKITGSFAQGSR